LKACRVFSTTVLRLPAASALVKDSTSELSLDIISKMETREERVKMYLRVLGDSGSDQYPICLEVVGRSCVRLTEPLKPAGGRKSGVGLEVFVSRDKIAHTPQRRESSRSVGAPDTPLEATSESSEYTVDYIFSQSDSLEFICNYLSLELPKVYCVVSIGKSDTLTGHGGVILSYLSDLFTKVAEVSVSLVLYAGDKCTNYLQEPYVKAGSVQEVLNLAAPADFLLSKRPIKEGIVVFGVYSSASGGAQFVESQGNSRIIELLLSVLTNSDTISDQRVISKNRLFDGLKRTLCADSRFIILGNATPTVPHYSTSLWVLRLLSLVMNNKHRCVTYYCSLLLKQVERLEVANAKSKGALEERLKSVSDELGVLQRDNEKLRELLAQPVKTSPSKARVKELTQELNDVKNLLMVRDTALADMTSRVRDLETEMENKAKGVNTQYRYLSGVSEEEILTVQAENRELRARNTQLSVDLQTLQKCLGRSKPNTQNAEVQASTPPSCRKVTHVSSISLPGKPSTSDPETKESLQEQLRNYKTELASLRAQRIPPSSENDKQAKALYRILTEIWIYTDSAVRGLKLLFDRMQADLELTVAERDLRIAQLEHQESLQPSKVRVEELEQKVRESERMAKEMAAMQATLAAKDAEMAKLKGDMKAEIKRLKKEFEDQLQATKSAQQKPASAELRSTLEALQEDSKERQKAWLAERQAWEEERVQLQETVAALDGQLASLKDLRKPLPPVSKRK